MINPVVQNMPSLPWQLSYVIEFGSKLCLGNNSPRVPLSLLHYVELFWKCNNNGEKVLLDGNKLVSQTNRACLGDGCKSFTVNSSNKLANKCIPWGGCRQQYRSSKEKGGKIKDRGNLPVPDKNGKILKVFISLLVPFWIIEWSHLVCCVALSSSSSVF